MNQALQKAGELVIKAIWAATAALLARIMEPVLKTTLFLSLRGLIWLIPDKYKVDAVLKEFYREMKKSYGEKYDLDDPLGTHTETPGGRNPGGFRPRGSNLDPTLENREAGEPE